MKHDINITLNFRLLQSIHGPVHHLDFPQMTLNEHVLKLAIFHLWNIHQKDPNSVS